MIIQALIQVFMSHQNFERCYDTSTLKLVHLPLKFDFVRVA